LRFRSTVTDEEEFAARSQLKWTRESDAWILLYRRRRIGRVVPDKDHPGMWRSVKVDGIDMANLSWAKDAVLAQAFREVASNPPALFAHLAEGLNRFGLAYLHVIEPRVKGLASGRGPTLFI
jgi:hypothetical protein